MDKDGAPVRQPLNFPRDEIGSTLQATDMTPTPTVGVSAIVYQLPAGSV